ncbi:hypothetical protein E2C01_024497 [Portunus trituberculatus]|uniref:Uncharacterized protein n=1 Tax=Portunus trituberculatus TaxID=210409 RepID=A0A5B7EEW3_PORTR|nr:hypothetical protein [Portunus trituberculatus]
MGEYVVRKEHSTRPPAFGNYTYAIRTVILYYGTFNLISIQFLLHVWKCGSWGGKGFVSKAANCSERQFVLRRFRSLFREENLGPYSETLCSLTTTIFQGHRDD